MNRIEIPKRNGKMRVIWVPTAEEKAAANFLLKGIKQAFVGNDHVGLEDAYKPEPCVHGFVQGRNSVTNALAHVGPWRFTLSMDIQDFFDNVRISDLPEYARNILRKREYLFPGGRAVQGLPCSPILANIAMDAADKMIMKLRKRDRFGWNFVYTRYADDLTFSFNHPAVGKRLEQQVPEILAPLGFKLNPKKTHWQDSRRGRRIITGVAVSDKGVHPTRKLLRQIRVAEHQAENGLSQRSKKRFSARGKRRAQLKQRDHAHGLREWKLLKLPKSMKKNATTQRTTPANSELRSKRKSTSYLSALRKRVITA